MDMTSIVGYIAATLTTFCLVPQVIKIMRERQTAGISLAMYSVFLVGICCWLVYGILIGALPIILSNVATILLVCIIIVMKIRLG